MVFERCKKTLSNIFSNISIHTNDYDTKVKFSFFNRNELLVELTVTKNGEKEIFNYTCTKELSKQLLNKQKYIIENNTLSTRKFKYMLSNYTRLKYGYGEPLVDESQIDNETSISLNLRKISCAFTSIEEINNKIYFLLNVVIDSRLYSFEISKYLFADKQLITCVCNSILMYRDAEKDIALF